MIIYGYRNREIEIGTGNFYCSQCGVQRPYRHKKWVRYFTLFFIPLFPLGKLSEYVECQSCGQTYTTNILSHASTTSMPISETDKFIRATNNPQSMKGSQETGQKSSCFPIILIASGAASILFGILMGIAMIAVQADGSVEANLVSLLFAILFCSAPMLLFGALAAGAGIFLLRQKQPLS